MMTEHSDITEPVRRIEVFTGTGRRRTWSAEDKARIVAESLTGDESVCAVARRHGLAPQQVFGWRRQLRQMTAGAEPQGPQFVPAVIEARVPERRRKRVRPRGRGDGCGAGGVIEVEIAGVTVRVGRGAEAKTVAAVLRALKANT